MTKIRDLQIGDKIYTVNICNKRVYELHKVIEVNEKMARTEKHIFKKYIKAGKCFLYSKAYMKYNALSEYFIETQELKDTFEKQQLIEIISKFDFKKLDLKTLIEINNKLTSN